MTYILLDMVATSSSFLRFSSSSSVQFIRHAESIVGESHEESVRLSLALSLLLSTAMHFDGFLQRGLLLNERGTARVGPAVGISRWNFSLFFPAAQPLSSRLFPLRRGSLIKSSGEATTNNITRRCVRCHRFDITFFR